MDNFCGLFKLGCVENLFNEFCTFFFSSVPILPESGLFNVDNVRVVKILVRPDILLCH